ncbi:MAG: hypothetical protein IKS83_09540 [Victivallales bacterium]|nr:hypothetical protein [Victivallales bacterium]
MKKLLVLALIVVSCVLFAENLFQGDSGYEVGLGYFNRTWFGQGVQLEHSDEGGAPQGRRYVFFPLPAQANYCYSGGYLRLLEKTDYVFSCYVKVTGKCTGKLGVVNSHWKDTTFYDFTPSSEWTRLEIPFQTRFTDDYWLLFDITSQDDAECQAAFDAIQLETGTTATAFTTDGLATSVLIPSNYNQVFFPEETPILKIAAFDGRGEVPAPMAWNLSVTDYQGREVYAAAADCAWEDGTHLREIPLPTKPYGLYTVRVKWQELGGPVISEQLNSYAVVPHPRTVDSAVLPYSGVNSAVPRGVDRLGVRWVEVGVWWKTLQPEEAHYNFTDTIKNLRELKGRGYQVKFTLVHLPCTPHWAWRADEVAEAKAWGFEPNYRFRPSEEAIPKLEKMFADFLTEASPYIDLIEIGGEDELIGGSEPYYRKKYSKFIQNGCVNGPVCESIAQMANACIRAAKRVCPEKPITVGRPSGGDCYANNFGFSRNVLKDITEPYDYFGMDCYTYQMRYLDAKNMPNIGSANRDYPGVFERARAMTAEVGKGQLPFVSEYGYAIDNRLAPDAPLQQEETARMLSAILTAKLLGSPFFFWFNTYGCIESGVFDYGMWHEQTPMLLIPAMAQATQVVEGVHQTDARLGTPDGNLKFGLFGQRDRAVLAFWTDRTPNPVRLALPEDATAVDFLGNPRDMPADGLFTATILPIYIVLNGKDAFSRLQHTLQTASDLSFLLDTCITLHAGNQATISIQESGNASAGRTLECKYRLDNGTWNSATKKAGKPLPWDIPLQLNKEAKRAEITIQDNSGQSQTNLLPFDIIGLQSGRNLIATFGNSRQDIVPPDPHIHWDGKDDLGGQVYLTCAPKTITIEAVVSDDRHCHNRDIAELWEGDCFQFAFVPVVTVSSREIATGYAPGDSEFIFALTASNGPTWQTYAKPYPAEPEYTIVRDEETHTTTYRITLQRKLIGLAKPGQFFRFCCVVFDDDEGGGQSYYYQLSPGITVTKTPAQFPIFQMP